MSKVISAISFVILLTVFVNYIVYVTVFKIFDEGIYIFLAIILTIIVTVIKRVRAIDGVYKGKSNFKYMANAIVFLSVINLVAGAVISKNTAESAYFWFSYTIMMASLVFFSFYLGKTYSGVNWFSFGPKETRKGKR